MGSGSGKSAIVAYTPENGEEQYVGMMCVEMPETRFEDTVHAFICHRGTVALDACFVAICEPDSFEVVGRNTSHPIPLGVSLRGTDVQLELAYRAETVVHVTVRVSGIRKGSAGRFRQFTKEQMERNEAFWRQARED
jgi:hypothetical protein